MESESPVKSITPSRARTEGLIFGAFGLVSLAGSVYFNLRSNFSVTSLLVVGGSAFMLLSARLLRYSYWASRNFLLEGGLLKVSPVNGSTVSVDLRTARPLIKGLLGETYATATGGYALVRLETEGKVIHMTAEQFRALVEVR